MTPSQKIIDEARRLCATLDEEDPIYSPSDFEGSVATALLAAEQRGRDEERERAAVLLEKVAEDRRARSYQQGGARVKRMGLEAQAFVLEKSAAAIRTQDKG